MGLDYQPAANPYPKARLNLSYITYLHTAYTLTGEQLYADKMAAIVRAYLANGVPGAELLRDDFFCGDLIEQLLMTYDACYKMFKPEELNRLNHSYSKWQRVTTARCTPVTRKHISSTTISGNTCSATYLKWD